MAHPSDSEKPLHHSQDLPDAFDLDNIRVMVNLLSHQSGPGLVSEVIELLHRMKIQYTQTLEQMRLMHDTMNFDPRTGLLRYQDSTFDNILKNVSRIFSGGQVNEETYALAYIRLDIDDFSRFNNLYGHEAGDSVLKKVGDTIRIASRPTDFPMRYGGEELDIILTATPMPGALIFMDRLFEKLREIRLDVGGKQEQVTLSAGVSGLVLKVKDILQLKPDTTFALLRQLQNQADDALYEAKFLGKNRYCVHQKERAGEYADLRASYQKNKK
ncbi:MAG: GGDEF domain-containing protein [Spirochaetia bacterium]|nr:GGDEF domain-containing protein [Spirochaetia bacterium]